jgi:hypothetical protein
MPAQIPLSFCSRRRVVCSLKIVLSAKSGGGGGGCEVWLDADGEGDDRAVRRGGKSASSTLSRSLETASYTISRRFDAKVAD